MPDDKPRQIPKYVAKAEKALGRRLPLGALVHHVNCDNTDHRNTNLVICQDRKYHALIHRLTDKYRQENPHSELLKQLPATHRERVNRDYTVQIRIEDSLKSELMRRAEQEGMSASAIVRMAVRAFIAPLEPTGKKVKRGR